MVNNTILTEEILQEKAFYDNIQYLPLNKVDLKNGNTINEIVKKIDEKNNYLSKSEQKAIEENLPVIKAVLRDRPELGEAKIDNMSWLDNDNNGKEDYPVLGMQACTFEREDQVYISFRGTPRRSWIDNAKGMGPDDVEPGEEFYRSVYVFLKTLEGPAASYYMEHSKEESTKEEKGFEAGGKLNGIFDSELYKYTTPMQEESIKYVSELKNPSDGSVSIFDRYENVYVTGHSKGGNEAVLVTILFSDDIDYCISGNGQGYSPEFVEYVKKTIGRKKFNSIQDNKLYGFHGKDDAVNTFGIVVIKEENRIYFEPEIKIESPSELIVNHFPQGMINVETGKLAKITEQGKFGKFMTVVNEKFMRLDKKDRMDAAWALMAPMQYLYARDVTVHANIIELYKDTQKAAKRFKNGKKIIVKILCEALVEKEGEEFIRWLGEEFGESNLLVQELNRAYDCLERGDTAEKLFDQMKQDAIFSILGKIAYNEKALETAEYIEDFNLAINMGGEYAKRYERFNTASELGVVAINYEKTKKLINIIDDMDNLVTGKILPEMDDIADTLRGLKFWRVNVRNWTDIRDSIAECNRKRKILRERLINYYKECESMELKFSEGMKGEHHHADVVIPIG